MERLERIRGCLLAGAAGDALGYQVEFIRLDEILRIHGENGVHIMAPHISDDTQMTLFTAEGMLMGMQHHMPMPACVYQSYLDWYKTQRPRAKGGIFAKKSELLKVEGLHRREAPGNTCLSALGSGKIGTIDEPINRSKGCGGVMRVAPCGMLKMPEMPDDGDAWAMQGAMAAAVTHTHVLGYMPAAMLADLVHLILQEDGRTLEELVMDSLKRVVRMFGPSAAPPEVPDLSSPVAAFRFDALIHRAVELADADVPDTEAIRELGEGWVGEEAMAIAVFCALRYQDDLAQGLSAAVTHDGDSDSTGSVAGNILGAWLGAAAIPQEWLDSIELIDVVDDMAGKLYRAGLE